MRRKMSIYKCMLNPHIVGSVFWPSDSYFLFAEERGYHKWALAHSSSCFNLYMALHILFFVWIIGLSDYEKCLGQTEGQTDRGKTVYPSGSGGIIIFSSRSWDICYESVNGRQLLMIRIWYLVTSLILVPQSWEAFLDPSDSYFLFADFVDFYTHWTYMLIFRRIFLSNYWWQKSDIWSQAQ
jgi:hypothetical protein